MMSLLIVGDFSGKQPCHLHNGIVKNVEKKLGNDANREDEENDWNNRPFLVSFEIGETGDSFSKRTAEERLHSAHKDNGGEKETKHRDGGIAGRDSEGTFENQKLADKSIKPGQPERRKHDHAHPATKERGALHQAAEIIDSARTAALFKQSDKIEQCRGSDAVIEDLHKHAAQGRLYFWQRPKRHCSRSK